MKKLILNIAIFTSILLLMNACVKDTYDGPDTGCIIEKPEGTAITIQDLLNNYSGAITSDVYIKGTVIADDKSGNFYKKIIIQDSTAGIAINIDRTNYNSIFPINRNIFVKLNGLALSSFGEIVANVDGDRILNSQVDEFIKKGECFQSFSPDTITLGDLGPSYVNKLVTILGVEFSNANSGITYADAEGQATVNLDLTDCTNTILVRTSGYSDFAGDTVPKGNGSITGVFNIFGSDNQIFIRNTEDVNMENARCDGSGGGGNEFFFDDFSSQDVSPSRWISKKVIGTFEWTADNFGSGNNYYCKMSNYNSGNTASEAWLITKALDLNSITGTPIFSFKNATNYNGPAMEVFISTDYDGTSDPNSATWTTLNVTLSTGSWDWVSSGDINLTAYQTASTYIAFKYVGSDTDGATWEIDDVKIEGI